jgi:hypothetical protein
MDQIVVPQRNARLDHPDLDVVQLEARDVGHFALPLDGRVVRWVVDALSRRHLPSHVDDRPPLDAVVDPAS